MMMANSANEENVNGKTNVDWDKALIVIQTTVHGIESDQRSLSADAGAAWKEVENLGGNVQGAKKFSAMLKKPIENRRDEFRTFINLAKAAGWFDWMDDLVDRAEGSPVAGQTPTAPEKPKTAPAKPAKAAPKDDTDLADDVTRINLKSGWLQRLKDNIAENQAHSDSDWEDVRECSPEELAAERDRLGEDFDKAGEKLNPEAAREEAAAKVGGAKPRKPGKLSLVAGGK